ncbi:MAG: DUF6807 family protein, partial [Planctomycetota bacterium]
MTSFCGAASLLASSGSLPAAPLTAQHDQQTDVIRVIRQDDPQPLLTQHVRPQFRPYLHPIVAPDGTGVLTQDSPGHHRHQTGVYWGFTRVNGRDFFHHPGSKYWRKVSAHVV